MSHKERLEFKLKAMREQEGIMQQQLSQIQGAIAFAESELLDIAPKIDWSVLHAKPVPNTV